MGEVFEAVRLRPCMFIGDVGQEGIHNLLFEMVMYSVREFEDGHGSKICIDLLPNNGCRIRDGGCGFPATTEDGKSLLEMMLTMQLTEDLVKRHGLRISASPHGAYLACANALSTRLEVDTTSHGRSWHQDFQRGNAASNLTSVPTPNSAGTSLSYWIDPEVFVSNPSYSIERIGQRCRELTAVNSGLEITLRDLRPHSERTTTYLCPNGLADFVREINSKESLVHSTIFHFHEQPCGHELEELEIATQWTEVSAPTYLTFAHSYATKHGSHRKAFEDSLIAALWEYDRKTGRRFGRQKPPLSSTCHGLTAVVSVRSQNPMFASATHESFYSPEIEPAIREFMLRHFAKFLRTHPEEADAIIGHILLAK